MSTSEQPVVKQSPPREIIDQLINNYREGRLEQVEREAETLTIKYPESILVWNILGAALRGLKEICKASTAFKKVIELDPEYPDGHNNLAIVLQEKGRLAEAKKACTRALSLKPDYMEAHFNMGNILKDQGMLKEAIAAYSNAIDLKPDYTHSHYNKGLVFQKEGKLADSIEAFKKVLSFDPNYIDAYLKLAISLRDQGKNEEAIKACETAVTIIPEHAESYNILGVLLKEQGKLEWAIEAYKQALQYKPKYAEAYLNLGVALSDKGDFSHAMEAYKKALFVNPHYALAHYNIGNILTKNGRLTEAIEAYRRTLSIKPDYADAYTNMGGNLKEQGNLEEAIQAYKKALSLKPDNAEAYLNMGVVLKEQGKLDEAVKAYDRAISLRPDYADAYKNLSFVYNLMGKLKKGFELYEWRVGKKEGPFVRPPRQKLSWDGSVSIKGKHIVVYEEQGLGDIIQFSRYLLQLEKMGAKVTFKVHSKMHCLLKTMDSAVKFTSCFPQENKFEFEAPLLSLPHLLNTDLGTVPSKKNYLAADPHKVASWGARLDNDQFKIGICWQGNKSKIDIGRSFKLSMFEDISNSKNIELVSLQKGEGEEQIRNITFDLTTLGDSFDAGEDAFVDTAAVMVNSDLIITSDTAIAHLAGALGRPTWVALKYIPDWRWMLERADSPWYPTMTLYRQKRRGDWKYVFDMMRRDLEILLEKEKALV